LLKKNWAELTHCVNGHEFDETNTYTYASGQKVCKRCRRDSQRKYKKLPPLNTPIGVWNKNKTHCANGHEYTADNIYYKDTNSRGCKKCTISNRKERLYGITPEQFDSMLLAQDGRCFICRNNFKDARDTHVDHCHKSGKVRSLLCSNCNTGLGQFKDSPEILKKAADYLISFQ
jgi:hypothetical protein